MAEPYHSSRARHQTVGLALGPLLAGLLLAIGAPDGLSQDAWNVAAMVVLMATWWVTEAIPIPATSLLPMVILPTLGVSTIKAAAAPYATPIVMLLLGGFIIAKSVERWNLHARIALTIVARAGGNPAGLIAGFMAAAALLSMWISNTATVIMLTPIAVSVAAAILGPDKAKGAPFTLAILLGLAYAASIGGLGTPVGTPTNLIVIGYLAEQTGREISFSDWMMLGLPVVAIMLPAAWFTLTRLAFKVETKESAGGGAVVEDALKALGPRTRPETRVMIVFALIAAAWMFRKPLNALEIGGAMPFAGITDHVIAIAGAVVFFLIPSGSDKERGTMLLDWQSAQTIPWGVYLLFGGGMSMAAAITQTGLGAWLGAEMAALTNLPMIVIMLALCAFVIFATELSSNVATASALLPVIGAISAVGEINAVVLAMPVAMAASCAFMLPMATGPNAIIFASGQVTIAQMARAGIRLNLIGILLISAASYSLVPLLFGDL